jgi:3-isopropylmalate/(R)-2-methylmalate dehydratase large subunit
MTAQTLFEKVWSQHVVQKLAADVDLLFIDRHLMHDLGGGNAIFQIRQRGLQVRHPGLTFATPDHVVETAPGRTGGLAPWADDTIALLRQQTHETGIHLFDVGQASQGIIHVIGPEQGVSLPGTTIVCGDSHTCTHGALGAIAFGIGITEVQHVLATQTLQQKRPQTMRVEFDGEPPAGVTAKDMILALIGQIGAAGATGYALEYTGRAIESLDMEARLTLCDLSIECGAKIGMIAPDQVTLDWLKGRPFAPRGDQWLAAVENWKSLASDQDAVFDKTVRIDCAALSPQITWGTSPDQVMSVTARVPGLDEAQNTVQRQAWSDAMHYMGLEAGQAICGTPIQRVFIGSCTNSRLNDLRRAASVIQGRTVAAHVIAWVVPGSMQVKQDAENEGLDGIFKAAGFEWREPGCSLCVGANGEMVSPGDRCVSTSNRNFTGRQGPGARTHLASPEMAAAAALAGAIVDHRSF